MGSLSPEAQLKRETESCWAGSASGPVLMAERGADSTAYPGQALTMLPVLTPASALCHPCALAQLCHSAPCPEPTERPRWTAVLHGVQLLLKWPEVGVCTQPLLLTHGKQVETAQWSLPQGTATSQQPSSAAHKALRRGYPVLAQRFAMWLWASVSKPSRSSNNLQVFKGVSWSSVRLDASSSTVIYLCDVLNMAANCFLFCCLEGLTAWAVSVQNQFLLIQGFGHRSNWHCWGLFPSTSREPAKIWEHPAFTIRCLQFNKDSWGILYLFLSWKRPMKTIFLCLAKVFLWQILCSH